MSNSNEYKPGNPEYDFWNDKNLYPDLRHDGDIEQPNSHYDPLSSKSSTLGSMVGGSIILTLFAWCFVGPILLLLWLSGNGDSFFFHLIFNLAFWGGIGFIILMTILGIIMSIVEHQSAKNSSTPKNNIPASVTKNTTSDVFDRRKKPKKYRATPK